MMLYQGRNPSQLEEGQVYRVRYVRGPRWYEVVIVIFVLLWVLSKVAQSGG